MDQSVANNTSIAQSLESLHKLHGSSDATNPFSISKGKHMVIIDEAPELFQIISGDTVPNKLGVAVTMSNYIRNAHKVMMASIDTISSVFPEDVQRSFLKSKCALTLCRFIVNYSSPVAYV